MSEQDRDEEDLAPWDVEHLQATQAHLKSGSLEQRFICDRTQEPVEALDLNYVIRPIEEWEMLKNYRSCNVEGQTYWKEQYVFVKHTQGRFVSPARDDAEGPQVWDCWVAKLLDFKASNVENVYATIFWMYWPEDLPQTKGTAASTKGRRSYHGKHELIASNHMEIINVRTLAGIATVNRWQEDDDEDDETQNGLYWRQTLDYRTGQLSTLQNYCICSLPYNPDKTLIQCPNEACSLWLHSECLTDSMLIQRHASLSSLTASKRMRRLLPKKGQAAPSTKKPWYEAEIVEVEGSTQQWVRITDLRLSVEDEGRVWIGAVTCPECGISI